MTEYKKYDTKSNTAYFNVRLAKDAEVKDFGEVKMVKLTFVDSSRLDSDEEMWVEANPVKSQGVIASYLEKGDDVSFAGGKLTFRRYGENNSQVAHNLRNAEVVFPPSLIATLKERGFEPGSDVFKGEAPPMPVKKGPGRPPGKASGKVVPPPATKGKKNIPIEIDLDDDEAEETEE